MVFSIVKRLKCLHIFGRIIRVILYAIHQQPRTSSVNTANKRRQAIFFVGVFYPLKVSTQLTYLPVPGFHDVGLKSSARNTVTAQTGRTPNFQCFASRRNILLSLNCVDEHSLPTNAVPLLFMAEPHPLAKNAWAFPSL